MNFCNENKDNLNVFSARKLSFSTMLAASIADELTSLGQHRQCSLCYLTTVLTLGELYF